MKIRKRFYVASRSTVVNGEWTHSTVDQAIAHAKRLMDEQGDDCEQYIVQVIRVVRRKNTPIVVERVE